MTIDAATYEKLGAFYLGRPLDLERGTPGDNALLYDAKDLVTHAFIVGMTGSGKTGLGIGLLEEAAIDGIPSIVVDPKGDLANLLLTFPELRGEDFRPWINEDDARRKGQSPDDYAAAQADLWRRGLADWGQGGDRIARLRQAADFAVYTPGSEAGLPVSVLASFQAPPAELLADADLLAERVSTTARSLLGLVGIEADPVRSREHILLATLFDQAWRQGRDLDLGGLIQLVQTPPLDRVGVLPLESFYPAKERFELAMTLNNLLAAPGFASWLDGRAARRRPPPLHRRRPAAGGDLLDRPPLRPRADVLRLAAAQPDPGLDADPLRHHQPAGDPLHGRDLRLPAAGGQPAVEAAAAHPAQAGPGLRRRRGARHPEPGRPRLQGALQHRHLVPRAPADRARQGAGARRAGGGGPLRDGGGAFDRGRMGKTLAGLGKRIFLLHNVHEDAPEVFETRWALSYLAGPLTRLQIARLTEERRRAAGENGARRRRPPRPGRPAPPRSPARRSAGPAARAAPGAPAPPAAPRPVLPPGIDQRFLPFRGRPEAGLVYRPALLGLARVHFADDKRGVDQADEVALLAPFAESSAEVDWYGAATLELGLDDLEAGPADAGAAFAPLPGAAADPKRYAGWEKDLGDALYRTRSLDLFSCAALSAVSKPGESERDFRIRLAEAAREERDRRTAALRQKYAKQAATFEERKRRAEQKVAVQREQSQQAKLQTAVSFGATLLGAFLGRKSFSAGTLGRASTAVRGVSRSMKESQDVARAREDLAAVQQSMADLDAQLKVELDALAASYDPTAIALEPLAIKPRRSDVEVRKVALAWAPYRPGAGGAPEPAWE